jgi:hypothetical protein
MALTVNRSKRWMGLDAKTAAGAELRGRPQLWHDMR